MAGEDARLKAGLKSAEDELNLIKNQIQQTLLDIREHILDVTNPFNTPAPDDLDDDEEMSIEDGGGAGGGGEGGEGDGLEGEGLEGEEGEDIESLEEDGAEDLFGEGDEGFDEELEEVPDDEFLDDGAGGGGAGGGLMDMLDGEDGEGEEGEGDEEEGFELDQEDMPELDAELEDIESTEDELPEDEAAIDAAELTEPGLEPTGDSVADAVAAALVADVDLLTMASLVRWTAVTRERIGANRLEILLDAYEMAGRLTPQMKNVIRALSALGDEDDEGIPVRDVVTAMVRMDGVLNSEENRESNRLLGLLLEMDDDPLDHLAA